MTERHGNTSMSGNGPAPAEAASLYAGQVMHARMKPVPHRFSYSVFSLLIDLDRLKEASRQSWFFSHRHFNLLSFHEKDHGPCDGSDLRAHVDRLLAEKGVARPARVLLLCYPRMLGYVFNPLSVYYAYDSEGSLTGIVYEVRNTFGDLHTYVAPVTVDQVSEAGIRQTQDKQFYVSPFLDMVQTYHFRMMPPGETVRVRILETDPDGPSLAATFNGTHNSLTGRTILRECLRMPFMTLKVMGVFTGRP
ncbi:DUF1365 domain-containing protein [Pannonibacter phragmitetus]|uniref:DUF1365 domain-containing protein n=1 Tax=Pannonibacter phragmitetus TaxID=121719 RepID=UPI003D2F150A